MDNILDEFFLKLHSWFWQKEHVDIFGVGDPLYVGFEAANI